MGGSELRVIGLTEVVPVGLLQLVINNSSRLLIGLSNISKVISRWQPYRRFSLGWLELRSGATVGVGFGSWNFLFVESTGLLSEVVRVLVGSTAIIRGCNNLLRVVEFDFGQIIDTLVNCGGCGSGNTLVV